MNFQAFHITKLGMTLHFTLCLSNKKEKFFLTNMDSFSKKIFILYREFVIYLGTSLSPSTHNSKSPRRTVETSRYGSHTMNPRPRRSTAARRIKEYAGRFRFGGWRRRNVRALPGKTIGRCSIIGYWTCAGYNSKRAEDWRGNLMNQRWRGRYS